MFVITPAEVGAVLEAYRVSGSLDAAAAALRAAFRALSESQARNIAADIVGVARDPEDLPRPPSAILFKRPQFTAAGLAALRAMVADER